MSVHRLDFTGHKSPINTGEDDIFDFCEGFFGDSFFLGGVAVEPLQALEFLLCDIARHLFEVSELSGELA